MTADQTEQLRTRWRRWLGNKMRRDGPYWTALLNINWAGWAYNVCSQHNVEYKMLGLFAGKEEVKRLWLSAIDVADTSELRQLDGLYCEDKLGWL